jgi:hypothetical protein
MTIASDKLARHLAGLMFAGEKVLVVAPRRSGKTTLAQRVSDFTGSEILDPFDPRCTDLLLKSDIALGDRGVLGSVIFDDAGDMPRSVWNVDRGLFLGTPWDGSFDESDFDTVLHLGYDESDDE